MNIEKFSYDNKMPRLFAMACVFWGAVGMLLGVIAAFAISISSFQFKRLFSSFSVRKIETCAYECGHFCIRG
jgi:cytochrome c oxidase cbb3-type subunit I/II